MAYEYKSFPFEIKEITDSENEVGEFSGYAAVFGNIDSYGDIILPGAFAKHLDWFLANGAVCWQHDWNNPIGKPLEAFEDATGLFVRGSIIDTEVGTDARKLLKAGVVKKLSIGFKVIDAECITSENITGYMNGMADAGEIANAMDCGRALKELKLYEFSPVTIPANELTEITNVKGDPLAGSTFLTNSESVLAAVRGYAQRVKSLKDLRVKEGRQLSTENHARLSSIHDGVDECLKDLNDLLTTCKPQKSVNLAQLAGLQADLLKHKVDISMLLVGDD
jgi:HK97 family phage prohead protease